MTCLTAPEVTEGPCYVNEFVRDDNRVTGVGAHICAWSFRSDSHCNRGAELLMDFGASDTTTCTPMNNTFVEIWHGESPCAP